MAGKIAAMEPDVIQPSRAKLEQVGLVTAGQGSLTRLNRSLHERNGSLAYFARRD